MGGTPVTGDDTHVPSRDRDRDRRRRAANAEDASMAKRNKRRKGLRNALGRIAVIAPAVLAAATAAMNVMTNAEIDQGAKSRRGKRSKKADAAS
jgi:hypothetical protein